MTTTASRRTFDGVGPARQPLQVRLTPTALAPCVASAYCAAVVLAALGAVISTPVKAQTKETASSSTQSADLLAKRVEQLEQQIADLQVVIGTLDSFGGARGGAASANTGPANGRFGATSSSSASSDRRLATMETQINALSVQIERMAQQLRSGQQGSRQSAISSSNQRVAASPPAEQGSSWGTTASLPDTSIGDFFFGERGGETPNRSDPAPAADSWTTSSQQIARAPIGQGDPRTAYETAYGYLLQQDYTSAEVAFTDFLQSFPRDKLASNAQYWLGESYFVRGQYKSAASAFLKGYETYQGGAKGPDSLLKLAMSLERLGQREAACSSLSELNTRFPQAPGHVKRKAQSERTRFRC